MKKSKRLFPLVVFLLAANFVFSTISAQNRSVDYTIHFKTGSVVPDNNAQEYLNSFSSSSESIYANQFFKIIQFSDLPDEATRATLKNAGVTLLDYLPNNAYFASFESDFNAGGLLDIGIRSIVDVETDYKLAPIIIDENYPDHAILEDGKISLLVSYYPNLDPDQIVNALSSEGYKIIGRDDFGSYANIAVPLSDIRRITDLPYVIYIEPVYPVPEPENNTARTLHRSNAIATDYGAGRHFDGTGVHVELQDDGVIGPHIDYQGRILDQFLSYNYGDHGDHTAGTIMGAGNVDPRGKGMAFGAELYVYGAAPSYPGFNAIPQDYYPREIRITSTSYSNGCNAGYTSLARTLDLQVRNFPSLMHVFSAGNAASDNCGYGAGPGWGNITGGHKAGKNVITVASLTLLDQLSSFSSRGPAHDGRIKPDIAAKGSNVYSTMDPNAYQSMSGTSMSCPGVAGTIAQLFQAYRETYNGEDPMAGLMKALILNTAEDLGNPGPDFKFGWGRINALRVVKIIEEARFDSATLDQGEVNIHSFDVPADVAQLKVMVYWTDYQATINSNWALVNNLDMTVTDPASTTWNPWKLSHYPDSDSLNMPATRAVDDRNNMEQVTLDYPVAGNYTLEVQGVTVPQGPQTYYIVYEFIPDEVILTYPIGGESLEPGKSALIRWDAFGTDELFTLEFSLDNGQSWDTIAENISGGVRSYNWLVSADISGECLIRITDDATSSQSDAPFSIIGVPCNLVVDWACTDAIHLSWSGANGATSYQIYKLGEKYMEPVEITTTNSILIEDTDLSSQSWFSVSAFGNNGAQGMRAVAVQNDQGTSNCNPVDAMMVSVPSVDWGFFQTWMNLSSVPVTVEVKNYGTEPITDPELNFQFDDGTIHTETYTGILDPDSVLLHTFAEHISFPDVGSHVLKAWVNYALDLNPDNDLIEVPIEVIEGNIVPIGHTQTFDNWTACWPAPICNLYSCDLEEGWKNLANDTYDNHDWRTFSGPTSTVLTGPSVDHTTGTTDGQYLYIEPSVYCLNKEAIISAPGLDLTNGVEPKLSMWYHAYGADIGWFHVDIFTDSDIITDVIPPIIGNQGNEWRELEIDLSPWVGQVIGLRFRGWTSCGEAGDLAIDDISLTDVTAIDKLEQGISTRLRIYPNPTSGEVTVSLKNANEGTYQLNIVDLFGRDMFTKQITSYGGSLIEKVSLSDLPAGIYLVQLSNSVETYKAKLTIR